MRKNYFYGNQISDYGIQEGYVDYDTLSKNFPLFLNNNIVDSRGLFSEEWKLINGSLYEEEEECIKDIYQYYIISDEGARFLQKWTDEIVAYNEKLNIYVWGITFLADWKEMLTDILISSL